MELFEGQAVFLADYKKAAKIQKQKKKSWQKSWNS